MSIINFIVLYWDERGAWREFGEFKTEMEARRACGQLSDWILYKQTSKLLGQSPNANKKVA